MRIISGAVLGLIVGMPLAMMVSDRNDSSPAAVLLISCIIIGGMIGYGLALSKKEKERHAKALRDYEEENRKAELDVQRKLAEKRNAEKYHRNANSLRSVSRQAVEDCSRLAKQIHDAKPVYNLNPGV